MSNNKKNGFERMEEGETVRVLKQGVAREKIKFKTKIRTGEEKLK